MSTFVSRNLNSLQLRRKKKTNIIIAQEKSPWLEWKSVKTEIINSFLTNLFLVRLGFLLLILLFRSGRNENLFSAEKKQTKKQSPIGVCVRQSASSTAVPGQVESGENILADLDLKTHCYMNSPTAVLLFNKFPPVQVKKK